MTNLEKIIQNIAASCGKSGIAVSTVANIVSGATLTGYGEVHGAISDLVERGELVRTKARWGGMRVNVVRPFRFHRNVEGFTWPGPSA